MRSLVDVEKVLTLVADGWSDSRVAKATGVNRATVSDWRRNGPPGARSVPISRCPRCHGRSLDEPVYAYLLGFYLGDGCISNHPRAYKLRIVQDARYPVSIEEIGRAMATVRGCGLHRVRRVAHPGCSEVYTYWQHWPCVFPQHGSGRKHLRTIALEPWQVEIVSAQPQSLLRGLIHSDGCRVTNRILQGRYAYPRYFFTNMSEDILQIFRDACDAVGGRHRNSKPKTISIARRESVARLDTFIGPKA